MRDSTIAGAFVEMSIEGAISEQIDVDPILFKHGISRLSLQRAGYRVPLQSFANLTTELMQVLNDEFLGLTARKQPLGSFNMMCRASISANTLQRSLQRCANFWNLFNNTFKHRVLVSGNRVSYQLNLTLGESPMNHYCIESLLPTIHRFHCWLGGQFIPLTSVSLNYPEPPYSEAYAPLFYGAPINFDQANPAIEFDAHYANLDIVQSPEALDQYLQGQSLSLLNQPKQYRTISDQVRRWLEKTLKRTSHAASLAESAQHFKLNPQVLHRRLRSEQSSFKELKMQTRRDLAMNLIFSEDYKIEEIATRIGFSEPSAFIRAFKSWTGKTPLQYRQHHH